MVNSLTEDRGAFATTDWLVTATVMPFGLRYRKGRGDKKSEKRKTLRLHCESVKKKMHGVELELVHF